jgi:hypothetical protein
MPQYTGKEGEIISVKKVKQYTCAHVDNNDPKQDRNFIEAEFFGLETFQKLLEQCGGVPVGFRVYYGIRNEDHSKGKPRECSKEEGGKSTRRLFIVPVDANGKELTGLNSVRGTKYIDPNAGLKDMPEDDGGAMGGGPTCPSHCG